MNDRKKLCTKHKCQDTHNIFNMNKKTFRIKCQRQDARDINIFHKEYGTKINYTRHLYTQDVNNYQKYLEQRLYMYA